MKQLIASSAAGLHLSRLLSIDDHYSGHIRDFSRFVLENRQPLTFETVKAYFAALNDSTLSAATVRVRRQAVKARLRAAMSSMDFNEQAQLEMLLKSLDRDLHTKAPKIVAAPIPEDKVVLPEEMDRLISAASPRTSLFLWFLYNTGCRVSEMCTARLDKTERVADMVRLTVTGKGRKERKVEIQASLFEDIRDTFRGSSFLFETRGGKAYQPTYVSYEIAKAGQRALRRRISAHTMRHSFATLAIRAGASVKAVSCYLGHSTTSITMDMYVHESLQNSQKIRKPYTRDHVVASKSNHSHSETNTGRTRGADGTTRMGACRHGSARRRTA